jgi:hypothetical protein
LGLEEGGEKIRSSPCRSFDTSSGQWYEFHDLIFFQPRPGGDFEGQFSFLGAKDKRQDIQERTQNEGPLKAEGVGNIP